MMDEQTLIQQAIAYLRREYGEETVRMDVVRNDVRDGSGVLEVDCTVRVGGEASDWRKWFSFRDGAVVSMRWKMYPARSL